MSENDAIELDEHSCLSIPSIWVVGDVTDRVNLPATIFSQPPIGEVGVTEEQAIKEYGDADIFTSNFRPLCGHPDRVFMKLIVSANTEKIIGIHMRGDDAQKIIQGFPERMEAGVTKANLDATLGLRLKAAAKLVTIRITTRKIQNIHKI